MASRSRVEVKGLGELGKRLARLGNAIPDAVQGALDDTTVESVKDMKRPMDLATEGGPTRWAAIKPGQPSSSVRPSRRERGAKGGVAEATVYVQKQQSAVFKYLLEGNKREDDERRPGDVGAAETHVFLPRATRILASYQGIRLTRNGNLPRSALRTLTKRAKSPNEPGGGRKRKNNVFFGNPKGNARTRSSSQLGFWQRPDNREGGLTLLVEAIPKADYKNLTRFDSAWNKGVEDGADGLPDRVEDAIEGAVRAASRIRSGRQSRA